MLTEICQEVNNWFAPAEDRHYGTFEIKGGKLDVDYLKVGQYFRVIGSVFNDGVWQYSLPEMTDEVFTGAIWAMSVPAAFIALDEEITAYAQSDMAKISPYTSESFGGYSYSRATDSSGVSVGWQTAFAKKLNKWRRLG